jgi:hypothetical protein
VAFAATAITVCTPMAVAYIRAHTKSALLASAAQAGAGVAYSALVAATAKGGTVDWHAAQTSAIANGVAAAEQLVKQSVSPEMVAGALGSLLAADPSVSATGSMVAPAAPAAPAT